MSARPLFQLLHDYAEMGESANISREGVKTLSREIRALETLEEKVRELLHAGNFYPDLVERGNPPTVKGAADFNFRGWSFEMGTLLGMAPLLVAGETP